MRAIYGVDLPAEAYAFWRAFEGGKLDLPVDRMLHPWELIAVQDPARPDKDAPWERELTLDDTYVSDEARAALQALPLPPGVLDLWLVRDA
jgi:hypothetical protein